jgi:hypothetical protein
LNKSPTSSSGKWGSFLTADSLHDAIGNSFKQGHGSDDSTQMAWAGQEFKQKMFISSKSSLRKNIAAVALRASTFA